MAEWKRNLIPMFFVGLAWPFFGLGYQAIQIGYVPVGAVLFGQVSGMFLAGAASSWILLTLVDGMPEGVERIMVLTGYLLFMPLGILGALAVAVPFEPPAGQPWSALVLAVPFLILLVAMIPVTLGMNLTRYLAVAVHRAAE